MNISLLEMKYQNLKFKYMKVPSCVVERSFNKYMNLLWSNRRSLPFENVKNM